MKEIKTNNGKKGGLLKGKPHYDKNGNPLGGIKAIVTDSGKPVELEGGEVIINKEASKKYWKELSRINQSAGNGVAIGPPEGANDEDPEVYEEGGRVIEFNPNHLPNKWIVQYAIKIKSEYPEIWKLGGNIFGNEAFNNLLRVSKRGYWLDSEEWMYIKWRSYVARHKKDFRIEGVIAMLKWCDKVNKGWPYMKDLIEKEIEKKSKKGWRHKSSAKMEKGGLIEIGYEFEFNQISGIEKWKVIRQSIQSSNSDKRKVEWDCKLISFTPKNKSFASTRQIGSERKFSSSQIKNGIVKMEKGGEASKNDSLIALQNKYLAEYYDTTLETINNKNFPPKVKAKALKNAMQYATKKVKETQPKRFYDVTYQSSFGAVYTERDVLASSPNEAWNWTKNYNDAVKKIRVVLSKDQMEKGGSVDKKDSVQMDIPLLIRTLELAREDVKSDAELHQVVERLIELKDKGTLTMDDYDFIAKVKSKHSKIVQMENGGLIIGGKEIKVGDTGNYEGRLKTLVRVDKITDKRVYFTDLNKNEKNDKNIQNFTKFFKLSNSSNDNHKSDNASNIVTIGMAPNGKKSNLTPEQYKLVRTPEFKAWFGDWENDPANASKAIDENGEPLVVYRGDNSSSKKGYIFKTGFNRMKFITKTRLPNQYFHYFVNNYNVALEYGKDQVSDHNDVVESSGKGKIWEPKVTAYFLNIRNPIDITPNNPKYPTFAEYSKASMSLYRKKDYYNKERKFRDAYDYGFGLTSAQLNKILIDKLGPDYLKSRPIDPVRDYAIREFEQGPWIESSYSFFIEYEGMFDRSSILRNVYKSMIDNHVDGLIFLESTHFKDSFIENYNKYFTGEMKYDYKNWNRKPKVFAVLESNQIKLADGTNTTFDNNNPDIRYEDGGLIIDNRELKVGDEGFYNGRLKTRVRVDKITKTRVYFTDLTKNEKNDKNIDNFSKFFSFETSTNDVPAVSHNTVKQTPLSIVAKHHKAKQHSIQSTQYAIPSTDSSTWDNEFNIGDKVKIRIDFTTDSTTDTKGFAGIGSYYSPENNFEIVDIIDTQTFAGPQNPTGKLYYLNNGQRWEGKDLELISKSSTIAKPVQVQKTSTQPVTQPAIPSTDSSTWDNEFNIGDNVKIRIDFTTDSTTDTKDFAGIGSYYSPDNNFKIVSISNAVARVQNPTGKYYNLNNGQSWEGKDLELISKSSTIAKPTQMQKTSTQPATQKFNKDLNYEQLFAEHLDASKSIWKKIEMFEIVKEQETNFYEIMKSK